MNKSNVVINCPFIYFGLYFFFLLTYRSHPSDKPTECSLVTPTLNKIDEEGLKRDINKFRQHYTEQAFPFWSDWQNNIDKLVTVRFIRDSCPSLRILRKLLTLRCNPAHVGKPSFT